MKEFTKKQSILFVLDILRHKGQCHDIYFNWIKILGAFCTTKRCPLHDCIGLDLEITKVANKYISEQDPVDIFEMKLMLDDLIEEELKK